uniref:Uncharacterized protein n=1 Tax=viral metagenome TaxID=1070528 RepID=A0A6C0JBA4_9ZZZZ
MTETIHIDKFLDKDKDKNVYIFHDCEGQNNVNTLCKHVVLADSEFNARIKLLCSPEHDVNFFYEEVDFCFEDLQDVLDVFCLVQNATDEDSLEKLIEDSLKLVNKLMELENEEESQKDDYYYKLVDQIKKYWSKYKETGQQSPEGPLCMGDETYDDFWGNHYSTYDNYEPKVTYRELFSTDKMKSFIENIMWNEQYSLFNVYMNEALLIS